MQIIVANHGFVSTHAPSYEYDDGDNRMEAPVGNRRYMQIRKVLSLHDWPLMSLIKNGMEAVQGTRCLHYDAAKVSANCASCLNLWSSFVLYTRFILYVFWVRLITTAEREGIFRFTCRVVSIKLPGYSIFC